MLRLISSKDILEAKLNLIKHYTQGHYGGISEAQAKDYVVNFFKSSKPSNIHNTYMNGKTTDIRLVSELLNYNVFSLLA